MVSCCRSKSKCSCHFFAEVYGARLDWDARQGWRRERTGTWSFEDLIAHHHTRSKDPSTASAIRLISTCTTVEDTCTLHTELQHRHNGHRSLVSGPGEEYNTWGRRCVSCTAMDAERAQDILRRSLLTCGCFSPVYAVSLPISIMRPPPPSYVSRAGINESSLPRAILLDWFENDVRCSVANTLYNSPSSARWAAPAPSSSPASVPLMVPRRPALVSQLWVS